MHGATLRFLRQYFRPRTDIVDVSETTFTRGTDVLPATVYRHRHREHYRTRKEARTSIFQWIECWYNRRRRHSSLGYLSPEAFEAQTN